METPAESAPVLADEPAASQRGGSLFSDLLSGCGLGLLLGMVVGLATSPVVGVVVGGLVSLLAVFLGLESRGGDEGKLAVMAKVQLNSVRIGAFGLAAVVGVLFGLWVRITNPLAEAPEQQRARWAKVFDDNPVLATQLMVYERFGILPTAMNFEKGAPAVGVKSDAGAQALRPGLFSSAVKTSLCAELAPERYQDKVADTLDAWGDEKGAYAAAAKRIRELPADQQLGALKAAHVLVCELGKAQAAAAPQEGSKR